MLETNHCLPCVLVCLPNLASLPPLSSLSCCCWWWACVCVCASLRPRNLQAVTGYDFPDLLVNDGEPLRKLLQVEGVNRNSQDRLFKLTHQGISHLLLGVGKPPPSPRVLSSVALQCGVVEIKWLSTSESSHHAQGRGHGNPREYSNFPVHKHRLQRLDRKWEELDVDAGSLEFVDTDLESRRNGRRQTYYKIQAWNRIGECCVRSPAGAGTVSACLVT